MSDSSYSEDRATTAKLAYQLKESAGREGVYYILRFPARWRLYAFPWDDFGDLWHGDVWRRFVVNDLAEAWSQTTGVTAEQLKPWWKGFPRGRIERAGVLEYTVFHADDILDTGITRERIERSFELASSKVNWSLDPHEQQESEHRKMLKELLRFDDLEGAKL